jgi:hypothetical protein
MGMGSDDEYAPLTWHGPFESMESAERHIKNFANPGGWSVDQSGKRNPPK